MANDTYYDVDNWGIWWIPEAGGYRMNDSVVDEANDATDTFFPFPGNLRTVPVFYLKRKRVYERIAGVGPDFGFLALTDYHEGKFTLSLDMNNFSMMYYLFGACTTSDDTPSAGKYTHVYATSTARPSAPKSFGVLMKLVNADTNHSIIRYFTGCVLKSVKLDSKPDSDIRMDLEILFANCVAGTPLTTPGYPSMGYTLRNLKHSDAVVTYAKGGTSYYGDCHGWRLEIDDGKVLNKPSGNAVPLEALHGYRTIKVSIDWSPKSKNHLDDTLYSPLDPATASDVDLTITITRTATTDLLTFAFEKIWCSDSTDPDWVLFDRFLQTNTEFVIKPTAFETGAKLTTTEVNALDDDRYET